MTTVTETNRQVTPGPRAATQAALDVMLTEAAVEPGPAGRLLRPGPAARLAGSLARRPQRVARRVGGLATELARVAAGETRQVPGWAAVGSGSSRVPAHRSPTRRRR